MISLEKNLGLLSDRRSVPTRLGQPRFERLLCAFLLVFLLPATSSRAAIERSWVGDSIPRNIYTGAGFILSGSDSLWLNDRLLQAPRDYEFDSRRKAFVLKNDQYTASDTLRVRYRPAPSWLRLTYGRQPSPAPARGHGRPPPAKTEQPSPARPRPSTDMSITGAKTVRFSAQSNGASEFGQSLDMQIEGQLSENVRIVGSVSDRGYDPSYGTANSRLSELDKINLLLTSPSLIAQVGDISPPPGLQMRSSRRVSGVSAVIRRSQWTLQGLAARPKGRFTTARFNGRDDLQGPYQITRQGPGQAIVPGSETVWLDGERLERGSDDDYVIDYPTGRITFAVNRPIDSRSRIEIDYEPLASEYRGEMFGGAVTTSLVDSLLTIETQWLREGDDPNQRLVGELTEQERELLQQAGDSTAFRSGVSTNDDGDYILLADSLPDSVFQYVGEGSGEYSVTFTYVGAGEGAYRYLGDNVYEWTGQGNGEYAPVVRLNAPRRTDYYRITTRLDQSHAGRISLTAEQTAWDRNLLSAVDDANNSGGLYQVRWQREFHWNGRNNVLNYEFRHRDHRHRTRQRLNRVDFQYDFLLPDTLFTDRDEALHSAEMTLTPNSAIEIKPHLSRLNYADFFSGLRTGADADIELTDRVLVTGGFNVVRTELTNMAGSPTGELDNQQLGLQYATNNAGTFGLGLENDRRRHDYDSLDQGTRYQRLTAFWRAAHEGVRFEYHDEDSLRSTWQLLTERQRLVINSRRSLGPLGYNATVSQQWLERSSGRESSFMGRLSYNFRSTGRGLNLSGTYLLSNESRQARGLTYLEVEPGQGDYILEDGRYIPDPEGNYLQVEEILSEQSRVRRGEKSLRLRRDWPWGRISLDCDIEEELLNEGDRSWWWILPVYSDPNQPYLYYRRHYRADIRLWPVRSWHAINYLFDQNRQQRCVASGSPESINTEQRLTLRQGFGPWRFSQEARLFTNNRDDYYSGGGDIEGYRLRVELRHLSSWGENAGGIVFRRAESELNQLSEIVALEARHRLALPGRGELRATVELYRQWLDDEGAVVSYTLTDNHDGTRGANWSLSWRWQVKKGWRIEVSFNGRHADNRSARIYGRSEVVAGF